ncbi:uncharacterized protein CFP56_042202 [Quercus suber]|uniref:Zinc knuckle CX2CX4HX4C domain-containing protein n=1 Tax=Quercus suber TaxID=58331 RepID=A0AAW0M841_QUESU
MDDILNRCAGLQLSEREGTEIVIGAPVTENNRVLAGKFYTKRRVNLESVARVLRSIWKTTQNFEVSDKYLLALHKLKTGEAVGKIRFDRMALWIQLHGIPTMFQTKEVGYSIGATIGSVESVDVDEKGFCLGNYMRIRVTIDISNPLCRGRKVRLGGSSQFWVDFKYERMPIFCYLCGMVTHDENDCLVGLRRSERLKAEDKPYGTWLRATQERLQKPQLVLAPSCDSDREVQRNTVSSARAAIVLNRPPRSAVGETHFQTTEEKVKEKGTADVGLVVAGSEVEIPRIPHAQRGCQFEEQLREIDAALCGDTTDTTNLHHAEQITDMTKTLQTNVQLSSAQGEEKGSANHNGSQEEFKNNTMTLFGPHGLNNPATQAQVSPPSLFPFNMGPTSPTNSIKPKLKKHNQTILKKGRVGPAMQRKENNARRGLVMEKSSGLGMGAKMDVEQIEKSEVRRVVKWFRMLGLEVKTGVLNGLWLAA